MLKLLLMVMIMASTHTTVSTVDPVSTEDIDKPDEWCHNLISYDGVSFESELIVLSAKNIVNHEGLHDHHGKHPPEDLLTTYNISKYWTPIPNFWWVTFDFKYNYTVKEVQIQNTGDSVHDVTSFTIDSSFNMDHTMNIVKDIDNVESGNKEPQKFQISGEGRYWRLTINKVSTESPPRVNSFAFIGGKNGDNCKIFDSSNKLPVDGQIVYLEKGSDYWLYPQGWFLWTSTITAGYHEKKDITGVVWAAWIWHTSTEGLETFYHLESMRYSKYFMRLSIATQAPPPVWREDSHPFCSYAYDHKLEDWSKLSLVPTNDGQTITLRRKDTDSKIVFFLYIPPRCKGWYNVGSKKHPSNAKTDATFKRVFMTGITESTSTTKPDNDDLGEEISTGLTMAFGGEWSTEHTTSHSVTAGFEATINISPGKTGIIYQKIGTYGKYTLKSVDFAACYK